MDVQFMNKGGRKMKVDNAIILAAGTASRFAPISYEKPKALIEVKGEVLIERQIRQLREAGIQQIIVVTGYKAEQFSYLAEQFDVLLVHNPDYLTRNNHSSLYEVRKYLKNSYICSSDNYFLGNPFEGDIDEAYYASVYVEGKTDEWCIYDENDWIKDVVVGGEDSWIMLGHVFFTETFSKKFLDILISEYDLEETKDKLWESIYIEHIDALPMKIRKYSRDFIFEFDTLDELRLFDSKYLKDTGSVILKACAKKLGVLEEQLTTIQAFKDKNNEAAGFTFKARNHQYKYDYKTHVLEEI